MPYPIGASPVGGLEHNSALDLTVISNIGLFEMEVERPSETSVILRSTVDVPDGYDLKIYRGDADWSQLALLDTVQALTGESENADGATTETPEDDGSFGTTTATFGLIFRPNKNISGIKARISANTSGFTTAYLSESDGTVLQSMDISGKSAGETIEFIEPLSSGTDYKILMDNGGSSYSAGYIGSSSFPYNGDDINITQGAIGGGTYSRRIAFDQLTSVITTTVAPYTYTDTVVEGTDYKYQQVLSIDGVDGNPTRSKFAKSKLNIL